MEPLLAVLAVVIAVAVPLTVAYQHRRQMRQIEAYRLDPSVGLKPPATWLARNFVFILLYLVAGAALAFNLWLPTPVDRLSVLVIALSVGAIVYGVIFQALIGTMRSLFPLKRRDSDNLSDK